MKSNDENFQKIINLYKKGIKDFAEEVSFEIESAYEHTIDLFYEDYGPNDGKPWFYDRTESTYLASNGYDNPFSPINVQQFGDSFFSGIGVSASNIPGNPYKIYKDWVFYRTFYKGIHGITKKEVNTRNEKIRQRYKKRRKLARMLRKRSKTFQIEVVMQGLIKRVPKNMRPAPKKIMDDSFKNLTKKKNMDRMLTEVLDKALQ